MSAQNFQTVEDRASLERQLSDVRRRADREREADVVVTPERRLILRSPDGHYWSVGVSNAGVLTTTDLGTAAL